MRIVFLNEIDELWNPYLEKLKRKFPDVEFISSKDYQNLKIMFQKQME